jgi:hypothetical protein
MKDNCYYVGHKYEMITNMFTVNNEVLAFTANENITAKAVIDN